MPSKDESVFWKKIVVIPLAVITRGFLGILLYMVLRIRSCDDFLLKSLASLHALLVTFFFYM